jgi:hypothetical protein
MSAAAQAAVRLPARSGLVDWARQGLETFTAIQSIMLELVAEQNALAIGAMRERLSKPRFRADILAAKLADNGIAGVTGTGKILLDFLAGETSLLADGLKEGLSFVPAAGSVAAIVKHRVETLVGMQKRLLDATAEQAHAIAESYQGPTDFTLPRMRELTRQAVMGFVNTEKQFLGLVSDELAVAGEREPGHRAARQRSKILVRLARQSVEKYIDAQKKLLELAIHQFEAARAIEKHAEAEEQQAPVTSWAELTQKSVRNFVHAEKQLMDITVKPKARAAAAAPVVSRPARKSRRA